MEVHLVADTNLFFECKALELLPWTELGYDPIIILLTKPVLDEIDKHKKANGRTRARALEIFGRVRAMLVSKSQEIEIQPSSPKVILRRATNVAPDPALRDKLDYTRADERLIGIASSLNSHASSYHVSLLTDDTGLASAADDIAAPCMMIMDSWRRPPSESTEEKRIKELEKDLATYRAQEPDICIKSCEPADAANLVECIDQIATPLTEAEILKFLTMLQKKHPLKTDFTPPPRSTKMDKTGANITTTYTSPPDDQIAIYREAHYPQWLERCRSSLARLHVGRNELSPPVVLRWSMSNQGTRPASRVRVEFEAKGPLELRRLEPERHDSEHIEAGNADAGEPLAARPIDRLPSPPVPPPFQELVERIQRSQPVAEASRLATVPMPSQFPHSDFMEQIRRAQRNPFSQHTSSLAAFRAALSVEKALGANPIDFTSSQRLLSPLALVPKPHDPEGFYYDWPSNETVKKGALTCDLWRHRTGDEVFEFEVLFTKDGEARGAIVCTVHAENLTNPVQAKIIVYRTMKPLDLSELAQSLVEACC